ncbi:MAG: thiamine diphosphokinase [Clostridium sp.]|nr:thiamine diphosphokinase [Clostridium sp.]
MAVEIKRCTVISGAPESDTAYYLRYVDDSYVICADSGYLKCKAQGIKPDLIIGDFDSSAVPDEGCELIKLSPRKDDSDTFHCIQVAVQRGYNDITILGGIGSRLDHTYSNILSVLYCFENHIKCSLVNANNYITIEEGAIELHRNEFKYFSLYALFEKCEGLSIAGAEYNLDNVDLLPSSQLNQSNEFKDDVVRIEIKKGKIILIRSND